MFLKKTASVMAAGGKVIGPLCSFVIYGDVYSDFVGNESARGVYLLH